MKKLVYIDACVREGDSRTRRIAEPVVKALSERYELTSFHLPDMEIEPLTAKTYADRAAGRVPEWAAQAARKIADADRLVIAAPFWDLGEVSAIAASNMDYITPEEIESKVAACIREGLELAESF